MIKADKGDKRIRKEIENEDISELKKVEDGLKESEKNLSIELEAAKNLQQISLKLIQAKDIEALYDQILETLMTILNADFASIQRFYPERGFEGELLLLAHRGFKGQAAKFWEWVRPDSQSTCGIALSTGQRIAVADVENSNLMAGSDDQKMYLQSGIHAVQTTPLISRTGTLLGMFSTHWRQPHRLTESEIRSLDILARQVADLIENKWAEEQIKRKNALLEGINKVLRESLVAETEGEVAGKCLKVAEELTDSKFGFLGEINENGRLDEIALGHHPVCNDYKVPPQKVRELRTNMEIVSYWGRAIKEEKSQIINDPDSDPDRRDVPEEHPIIESFMGIPLKQSDKTIGLIALANKKGGYSEEDKDNIEALSIAFVEALMRKRAELKLKETLNNMELIVDERTVELKNAINDLKRSNEELEQFAYVASHDLQEPLRTIASFTQLLERRYKNKFDEDADEFMNYIVEAAVRMKTQIEGLLEYSRVATKGEDFELVNINEIVNQAIKIFNISIEESDAEIKVEKLPSVMGDAGQLERVFQNLISNAIKFRKCEERPKIHISAYKSEDKKEYVFKVQDNGIGIEEQYKERIFTLFQRLHPRNIYKGTGIGLSIVKRIIERHEGRVWVESSFGVGSTFYFTLPPV